MNALLCIGCNAYESLNPLKGAEFDAQHIYETLLDGDLYDASRAILLKSPQLSSVISALNELAFKATDSGVLTVYFAGHGCVSNGSYYLAVRDTQPDRHSVTGLSMDHLFRIIGESKPRTANIVIDACQAAGSVYDLPSLLNRDVIGKAHDSCGCG